MPKLTEHERAEFIRIAKSPPILQPKAFAQPLVHFLRALSTLSRTDPSYFPVRFQGKHWHL
jgi:hypothetical protein